MLAFEVVKIVIARSGIALSPVFATERVRFVFCASCCLLGKFGADDLDREVALWLVRVLALAPAAGGDPRRLRAPPNPIPTRLRALTARAVEALSSKGAGNIPRTLPPPFRLRIVSSGGFLADAEARLWVAHGLPIT